MWRNHSGIWYFWSPFAAGRGVCSCWLTRVSGNVKKTDQPPAGSSNTIFLFSVFLGLVEIFIRALESKTLWRKKILIHMQNTTSVWVRIFEFVLGFFLFHFYFSVLYFTKNKNASSSVPVLVIKDLSALQSEVCVLVFSVTDRRSFHRTAQLRLLLRETQPQTPIILVGNKSDLVRTREVTSQGETIIFSKSPKKKYFFWYITLYITLSYKV